MSVACVGPGGCTGGQVCRADGTFDRCDCGEGGEGGSTGPGTAGAGSVRCGGACEADAECGGGVCVQPAPYQVEVDGFGSFERDLYPNGMCSARPLSRFRASGACDPTANGLAQGCGSCGVCTFELAEELATVCRERCQPTADTSGCSRPEYTCDFVTHACIEGCLDDDECRIHGMDTTGDGAPDAFVYDTDSQARCDTATRRCHVDGSPGAQAGIPCERNDDCEADGICLRPSGIRYFEQPWSGGYCTKAGCDVAGRECAGTAVCVTPRSWSPTEAYRTMCAQPCEQGVEPAVDRLGPNGHAADCREGYACLWGGARGDPSGLCVPGNYNDVAINNVGDACAGVHADCFSPYGHGRCLLAASGGDQVLFCTIFDCDSPGMPTGVCGDGNRCLRIDDERAACVRGCADASECAPGLACLPTSLGSVCFFGCRADAECREGDVCAPSGACISG